MKQSSLMTDAAAFLFSLGIMMLCIVGCVGAGTGHYRMASFAWSLVATGLLAEKYLNQMPNETDRPN